MKPSDLVLRLRSATLLALALSPLAAGAAARAQPATEPVPFVARFNVEWKGLNAGTSTIELIPNGAGRYTYSSGNQARGIFRLAFPDTIRQISVLQIENGVVRPLSFRADDGSKDTSKDVTLQFDWTRGRITGTSEKKPVDIELKPGTQDAMSSQLALILDLQAGRQPTMFWMADKDQIKEYIYANEGEARLATPLGTLQTVVWSSHRPNSDRITRIWYAPSLGYTPVQASRTRGGKLEWTMKIQKLERPAPRANGAR